MNVAMMREIDRIRRSCISCGRCSSACPSFEHGGIDPLEVMVGGDYDIAQCISCGNCSRACHHSDPFAVMRMLTYMENNLSISDTYHKTGYVREPVESDLEPDWIGTDAYVMPGCVVVGMAPFIEYAASVALSAVGVKASRLPGDGCCLHPIQFAGMPESEKRSKRVEMCAQAEGKEIMTLCAGCSEDLEPVYSDTAHIIEFMHRRIDSLPRFDRTIAVGMEPGCSAMHLSKKMKAVLEAMNCRAVNVDMGCCGKNAPVNKELMADRETECSGAEVIVVGCPMCFVKFDSYDGGIPVMHLAELIALAAGDGKALEQHKIRCALRAGIGNNNYLDRSHRTITGSVCIMAVSDRVDVIWYGRGGQGAFTASKILGAAFALGSEGGNALSFPSFGPERRGAPVRAFTKLAMGSVRDRSEPDSADFEIYLDRGMLKEPSDGSTIIVNTPEAIQGQNIISIDATALATEVLGAPIVNTAMVGALAAIWGKVSMGSVFKGIEATMPERLWEKNKVVALRAFEEASE